jgi:hypothetical protein
MKRWSLFLLRLLVTSGLIYYVLTQVDWTKFSALLKTSDKQWLIVAFLCYGSNILFSIIRWQLLLNTAKLEIGWKKNAQLTMIGLFANSFMPGAMGGDLIKAYYANSEAPQKKTMMVITIIMERLLGFASMFVLSMFLIFSRYEILTSEAASKYAVYFYFFILGVVLFLLTVMAYINLDRWIPGYEKWGWKKNIDEAVEAYRFLVTHKMCFWGGLLISGLAHVVLIATFYFIALGLRIDVPVLDFAAVLPLISVVTLIPVTINGIGLREFSFTHFFSVVNIPHEASLILSVSGFLIPLAWSLIGGVVYLYYKAPWKKK